LAQEFDSDTEVEVSSFHGFVVGSWRVNLDSCASIEGRLLMLADGMSGSVLRYCPKCGAAALRMTAGKLLRCEACGFEFYLNTAAAVAGLITDAQGRLLITVRGTEPGKGRWDLPGGFADPGESAEEALRREVREEVGLEVTAARYVGSYPNTYDYMGVRYSTMDLGFACQVQDSSRAQACESDIEAVLFKRPGEIDLRYFAFRSLARLVERWREVDGAA
jgi:NADH pyrophosphatase NudC (nudix superfamily)